MEIAKRSSILIILLVFASSLIHAKAYQHVYCDTKGTRCYGKYITCPAECPDSETTDPKTKVCQIDYSKPICKAVCKSRKPNCNAPGSRCYDPLFIGGDGRVFYFHGKSNEHFTLVSDSNLQINARFIRHRPAGKSCDYTWIQALGILFNSKTFSLEATKTPQWDGEVDHLKFISNGNHVVLSKGSLSTWYNEEKDVKVERVASKNSVMVTLKDVAEILVNVVPVAKEDDKIHNYQVPSDDCFAHLEVQFRFFALSPKVDGVLGRTYKLDFENPAKLGVAMPVVGGEDIYKNNSLLFLDCASCVFSQGSSVEKETTPKVMEYGTLDCTKFSYGLGIICRK
ncbi:Root cap [Spatholobus suberectus]|nr:Root cap [Spatholobus suberectus]